ncbi:hypothetical protein LUZ62_018141 [Rhynchospora pubera]|uniref:Protein FAR1-RELATED SEQUENCE n=1 Tax=Rhynchospora pubera TaxID=906938 RepID=A0AAV8GPN8_9POAL|nr:hypothetical protein LUZ62_018141 [Rhynchospora pubera]
MSHSRVSTQIESMSESEHTAPDANNIAANVNNDGAQVQGLLCPHAMKVMWILGIQHLPSHYILKRWCKNANAGVERPVSERSRDVENSVALQMFRATTLKKQFSHLVEKASKDVSSFKIVDDKLRELVSLIDTPNSDAVNGVAENDLDTIIMIDDVQDAVTKGSPLFLDPPISQCKGKRKRPERWKTSIEKAPIKGRTCSYCGLVNKHNIRTCPKKLEDAAKERKGKDMKQINEEELHTEDDEEYLDTEDDEKYLETEDDEE